MNAENAILTKVRAMYAQRLTQKNYTEMLGCKSVHDIAAYLKNKTHYGISLEKLNIASIHRGWLEANLRNVIYEKLEGLSHYDYTLGDKFYQYFVVTGELEQILRCAALIHTGSKEKYLLTLPPFFNERSSLDLVALGKAETMGQLLACLEGTPYYAISSRYLSKTENDVDMVRYAREMDQYRFQTMFTLIRQIARGKHQAALTDYGKMLVDLYNIEAIARVNRLRRHGSTLQYTMVTVEGGSFTNQFIGQLAEAPDTKTFMKLLRLTKYSKYLTQDSYDYIELATQDIAYRTALHTLRFSVYPSVVLLAYVNLLETELDNIIHIVEGIRYQVRTEAIHRLLIGADQES